MILTKNNTTRHIKTVNEYIDELRNYKWKIFEKLEEGFYEVFLSASHDRLLADASVIDKCDKEYCDEQGPTWCPHLYVALENGQKLWRLDCVKDVEKGGPWFSIDLNPEKNFIDALSFMLDEFMFEEKQVC